LCVEVGGVLTGEHGVGIEKRDLMPIMFDPEDLAQQMRVKCAFDPSHRLNPGKVFPSLSACAELDRKSTRLNSSHVAISYAVFCSRGSCDLSCFPTRRSSDLLCVEVGGVLTGEHGVGIEKRDLMPIMFDPEDLAQQMRVKCAFDPSHRLNPGKVFPSLSACAE